MRAVAAIGVLAGMIVAGCSALPTARTTRRRVQHQEIKGQEVRFDLVDIDDTVVAALLASPAENFHTRFKKYGRGPPPPDGGGGRPLPSRLGGGGGGGGW